MNSNETGHFVAGVAVGFVISIFLAFTAIVFSASTPSQVQHRVRQEAVEAGVARWTVDQSSGKISFEWIKNDKHKN